MKFLNSVIFVIILPFCYLLQVSVQESDNSLLSHFVFPKDRNSTAVPRIIGGQEVTPHTYPFQVALLIYYGGNNITICGGTLITNRWILTAAHCVEKNPNYVLAILGAHNLTAVEPSKSIMNCTQVIVHRNWNQNTLQNDIALVKLPQNATINNYVNTVALANSNDTYANVTGTTIGWGMTEAGDLSLVLRQVSSLILSNQQCTAIDPFQQVIIDSHLCLSGTGIVGSCSGDSGGPLLVNGVQVGIVSFGYNNCLSGKPSVFTRLTDFHDWIITHAGCRSYENLHYPLIVSTIFCLLHWMNAT